jgi:hypothetical protein
MGQLSFTTDSIDDQLGGVYAEIYANNGATPQTIATGASYVKCTGFTDNGVSNGATADVANDKIIITKVGDYKIECSVSFTGAANLVNWFGSVFVDDVEQDQIHFQRKLGTGGDFGSTQFGGMITVASVPMDVDLRFRHDKGSDDDITIKYANLNALRVAI